MRHLAAITRRKPPKAGDTRITAPVLAATDIAKLKAAFARIQPETAAKPTPAKRRPPQPVDRSSPKPCPPVAKPERPPSGDPIAAATMRARTSASLTQNQLAERLKTDQGNIARLERGRSQRTIRTLRRIAEATGHSLVVNFRPIKQ
jgi:ribosome-binding protein aMBF1 (putative translation factor)